MFSFFRRQPPQPKSTLDFIAVDIHNHLIPGIDDGSPNVETSLQLMEVMMQLGYKAFYCTPHVILDVHPNTPETIGEGFALLQAGIAEKGWNLQMGYSAEYMMNFDMEEIIQKRQIIPLAEKYVLVEMSYAVESPNIKDIIFQMQTRGLRPILAHPERYPYYHRKLSYYEDLVDAGAEFQINLLSLIGYYGNPIQKIAEKLIDLGWVNWVGTDLHHGRHLNALVALSNNKRALQYIHKIKDLKNPSLLK